MISCCFFFPVELFCSPKQVPFLTRIFSSRRNDVTYGRTGGIDLGSASHCRYVYKSEVSFRHPCQCSTCMK